MTYTPSYGDHITATSKNTGVTYTGWYIASYPDNHPLYGGRISLVESSDPQRLSVITIPILPDNLKETEEKLEMCANASTIATYFTAYVSEYVKTKTLSKDVTDLQLQHVKDQEELAATKDELDSLKAKVAEVFRLAAAQGYQSEASSLAAQVGLAVPALEEFDITVNLVGETTVTKQAYSLEDAIANLTEEEVRDSILTAGVLESWGIPKD